MHLFVWFLLVLFLTRLLEIESALLCSFSLLLLSFSYRDCKSCVSFAATDYTIPILDRRRERTRHGRRSDDPVASTGRCCVLFSDEQSIFG